MPGNPYGDGGASPRAGPLALASPAFRRLFRESSNAMVITDDSRRYLAINDAACRLFGLTAAQIVGRRIDDFTPREFLAEMPVFWAQFLEAGTQAGRTTLRVGGRTIEMQFAATANIAPGQHLSILFQPGGGEGAETVADVVSPPRPQVLTKREREVLTLLAHGKSGVAIARDLALAPDTVRNHVRSARVRLGAKTRAHAIALALSQGEIPKELPELESARPRP